jgi:hypothetical protein
MILTGAFAVMALWALISPTGMISVAGVDAVSPDARAEIRAFYGGIQLGIAALLAWHWAEDKHKEGLGIAGVLCLCAGGCRLLSAAFSPVGWITWALVVFELGGAVLCAWGYRAE